MTQKTRTALKSDQAVKIGADRSGLISTSAIKDMLNDLTDSAFIKESDTIDSGAHPIPNALASPLSYRSGKYYIGFASASFSTLALSANTQYFSPIYISEEVVLSGIGKYQTSTGNGGVNFRVAIYEHDYDVDGPGNIVSGTDTADTGEAAAGKIDTSFSSPVTLSPGIYWISILTDAAITFTAVSNLAQAGALLFGAEDIGANSTGTGLQPKVSSVTYGAMPTTAGTLEYGSTGTNIVALFAKVN